MRVDPIRVEGLARLNRALKTMGSDLPKGLRLAGNEAALIVVSDARPKVPRRTGRAMSTIRAASTRTASRVTEGGKMAPYMPWLDYGGKVGREKKTVRPFVSGGRYVYPSFHENRDRIERVLFEALGKVVVDAGLETD
jgi:hypothetical protein